MFHAKRVDFEIWGYFTILPFAQTIKVAYTIILVVLISLKSHIPGPFNYCPKVKKSEISANFWTFWFTGSPLYTKCSKLGTEKL